MTDIRRTSTMVQGIEKMKGTGSIEQLRPIRIGRAGVQVAVMDTLNNFP
ncbi:MAG: hypothetical protein MUC62_06090 [Candidatus Thermoplasmatota archaeon]|jgi:hypothetical protein|nr:hypothetical protein [Candidatus Thermoplasmatota archaeon]